MHEAEPLELHVPAKHEEQLGYPLFECKPAEQLSQNEAPVFENLPAAHDMQAATLTAFEIAEYVPAEQFMHCDAAKPL